MQRICRPSKYQKEVYSGHKRVHCLKYQSIVTPNGMIANLYGPEVGRRHDSYMLKQSKVLEDFQQHLGAEDYYIYGDSGYPMKRHLITPYLGSALTDEQIQFNVTMSKMRIAVEWEFGDLYEQFAFLSFKYNHKIFIQQVAKCYLVSTILKNCRTCLYGSQTSQYFNCSPPTLEEYLCND